MAASAHAGILAPKNCVGSRLRISFAVGELRRGSSSSCVAQRPAEPRHLAGNPSASQGRGKPLVIRANEVAWVLPAYAPPRCRRQMLAQQSEELRLDDQQQTVHATRLPLTIKPRHEPLCKAQQCAGTRVVVPAGTGARRHLRARSARGAREHPARRICAELTPHQPHRRTFKFDDLFEAPGTR